MGYLNVFILFFNNLNISILAQLFLFHHEFFGLDTPIKIYSILLTACPSFINKIKYFNFFVELSIVPIIVIVKNFNF
ncbi:MAG: hypothetical protein EA362_07550 [Saprospirales bacterium]|nr:MAG: hypothetical protein EA362_07550 [Saprospirales bacterium]